MGKKLTVYERIETLLDKGSFTEVDKYVKHRCIDFGMENKRVAGDGVVCGYGKIDGRTVYVYAFDFSVLGGSLSAANSRKIAKMQDMALKCGAPIIGLNDSGGARIQEGVESLTGFAEIFRRNVMSSGVIPQISAIMGPCAGGSCYSPALTDFILMVEGESQMFITGPNVIRQTTNEECDKETLGGAKVHAMTSGVCSLVCRDDEECLMTIRELLGFIPSNNMEDAPVHPATDDVDRVCHELDNVVPANPNIPYNIEDIIKPICDQQYFFEIQPDFAKNIVVGFGRMAGRSVGFVANQPNYLAGAIDIDASDKAARFIQFCDSFNIPIVAIEDVPGFLPGIQQEHAGIIRHGAKIVYAFAEATVPKITLITRKAYGGAYIVMNSKQIGADINLAYPSAEIAVMGAKGAVSILYRKEEPENIPARIKEYEDKFANPYFAAELGYIDDIIQPADTRRAIIRALDCCRNKSVSNPPKKHGNMPM